MQLFNTNPLAIAIILIMILGYITVIQRVYHSWKELNKL
jgi:archaetidylinositol phosphate synthase